MSGVLAGVRRAIQSFNDESGFHPNGIRELVLSRSAYTRLLEESEHALDKPRRITPHDPWLGLYVDGVRIGWSDDVGRGDQ